MNTFSTALFLHIIGSLGVSAALGVEWIGMSQIQRMTVPKEIFAILQIVKSTNRLGFISMLVTVMTGFYMVLEAIGFVPWIIVVLAALFLVIALSRTLTAPRMTAIGRTLTTEKDPVSQAFRDLVNDPVLWISLYTRVTIVLGIIFLKIATPGWVGSLLTISIAILLGIASALARFRTVRARKASADTGSD